MTEPRQKAANTPKSDQIDPERVFHLASEGFGLASIAAMLGISRQLLEDSVNSDSEVRSAWRDGSELVSERQESRLLQIMSNSSSTNRDVVQAFQAWARYNPVLTKKVIKAKLEGFAEATTPELQSKLESLLSRATPTDLTDSTDDLQQRLNAD